MFLKMKIQIKRNSNKVYNKTKIHNNKMFQKKIKSTKKVILYKKNLKINNI